MILIFLFVQTLNLIVNHSGVKARLIMTQAKDYQAGQQKALDALESLKGDYQRVIDRYPPTDKNGKPVVWKSQITEIVEMAHGEIRRLNSEIMARQLHNVEQAFEPDKRIVLAWLLLPECCMLTVILVFSIGIAANDPKFKS
jgi:membrane-bound lytic murein transglycosylase B